MEIYVDSTGFPLVKMDGLGLMHLWPVTKVQFELFLSEPNEFGDIWYEMMMKLNPRVSFRYFKEENYEMLFMTGMFPAEAIQFAKWLGNDYDLPTVSEWRSFYRKMKDEEAMDMPANNLSLTAKVIWQRLASFTNNMLHFSLMDNGIVEWVRNNGSYVGLGAPRHHFHPNAWNPLLDSIKVIHAAKRIHYTGFRLLKREVRK